MKAGFSGSREGMTKAQWTTLRKLLLELDVREIHHGDCKGADVEAARLAHQLGCTVVCHPPEVKELRAFTDFNDLILPIKNYFARNRDIVNASEVLIACPKEPNRRQIGGTHYTINYAERKGRRFIVVWPDGSYEDSTTKKEIRGE